MRQQLRFAVLGMGLFLAGGVHADVLTMPEPAPAIRDTGAAPPSRGQTMDQVRARLGEPESIRGPIGDPPITRWDYGTLVVVFEHRQVITSIVPGAPPPIFHREELERR